MTHFPATLLVTLSWFQEMEIGMVESAPDGGRWKAFGSPVLLSGSQAGPTTSWAPTQGRGVSVCFTADMAQALFGLDMSKIHDRIVDARPALGNAFLPMLEDLLAAKDDAATLSLLEHYLAPRCAALRDERTPIQSLRRLGQHWVEKLGWQARQWAFTRSPRQVERRIKAHSGRSLREWQTLVRTEGAFFAARERYENGRQPDWAELAQDEGFADQSHFSRASKRITGFAPSEFAKRFIEDESFWLYRLWM
ncbi:helix-turn-helix domain-containing protein [Chromobacterium alticapitis]|uniref:helix-turn-helix domain-containing protein n=1 Tax=Chromobacterium alticapitis TaxID=2073169 RepID=UPI0018ED6FE5|nr:AraC family transcriptional regulator [Chromobacterium alticapitis]